MRSESEQAASVIRSRAGDRPVDVAVVLGSGSPPLPTTSRSRPSSGMKICPVSPARWWAGMEPSWSSARLGRPASSVMKGRVHHYETGNVAAMRVPLEAFALVGANAVVLTNAAGSTRPELKPGSLMVIRDHINLTGQDPLTGETGDSRFGDLTTAYDPGLRGRFARAAPESGLRTGEGVYMWRSGLSFETPAEIQVARMLGADLVGMSTVPEVIMARHIGLRVLAVSMVTNFAAGLTSEPLNHARTMRAAAASIVPLTAVLVRLFGTWTLELRRPAG